MARPLTLERSHYSAPSGPEEEEGEGRLRFSLGTPTVRSMPAAAKDERTAGSGRMSRAVVVSFCLSYAYAAAALPSRCYGVPPSLATPACCSPSSCVSPMRLAAAPTRPRSHSMDAS